MLITHERFLCNIPSYSCGREISPFVVSLEFRRTVGSQCGSNEIAFFINVISAYDTGSQREFRIRIARISYSGIAEIPVPYTFIVQIRTSSFQLRIPRAAYLPYCHSGETMIAKLLLPGQVVCVLPIIVQCTGITRTIDGTR